MNRISVFLYGLVCYAIFFATFLYTIGFVGNLFVPKSIDSGEAGPLGIAIAINLALVAVFGLQHSVMARPWFKDIITRYIPEPAERSTYVLLSSVALVLLFWLWQPMGGVVWTIQNDTAAAVAWAAFGSGWLIILVSSFFINHFDLFGLRQVWLHLIGKEYTHLKFRMPGPYKYIRHPLYQGKRI